MGVKTLLFNKTECGVTIQLNVLLGEEVQERYSFLQQFNTDFFEVIFFKEAKGYLILNEREICITNNTVVFISPFQKRQWQLEKDALDFTVLIFQEDFLNEFFADKWFTYRLLYFYQLDHPLYISQTTEGLRKACDILKEIKTELVHSKPDSEHLIRSLLYYLLLKLNRV